jgi:hypothetical protein
MTLLLYVERLGGRKVRRRAAQYSVGNGEDYGRRKTNSAP